MLPLPRSIIDAVGSFLIAILFAICTHTSILSMEVLALLLHYEMQTQFPGLSMLRAEWDLAAMPCITFGLRVLLIKLLKMQQVCSSTDKPATALPIQKACAHLFLNILHKGCLGTSLPASD